MTDIPRKQKTNKAFTFLQLIISNRIKSSGAAFLFLLPLFSFSQTPSADTLLQQVTLQAAIEYAVKHQPRIQQALVDEDITMSNIRSRLADWFPQINLAFNLQHNFELPTSFFAGNSTKTGVYNTSAGQLGAMQNIFNRDLLLAGQTKGDLQLQSRQITGSTKIDIAVNVAKAFYDVITTSQQIKVAAENIIRNERSLKDATAQYNAGLADKTDYKRATINLNNIRASKNSNEQSVKAGLEYLKSLMGYPETASLNIVYDSAAMEREAGLDTLQQPDYTSRIEYKILETQSRLLKANVMYNKWSYLPAISANFGYNINFLSNTFDKLYANSYPNSFAGLVLAVPVFQGGKRKYNIRTSELQLRRNELDIANLRNTINAQYARALAGYRSSYTNYLALKENVALAKEVYDVIQLQYRSGIKTYLEVITSETDLRTAQINYFNALNQVLSNKIDVQRALGQLVY